MNFILFLFALVNPTHTFTFPIPTGCTAAVVGTNVVFTCPTGGAPAPFTITTPVILPPAKIGVAYLADVAAAVKPTGGKGPYTFKPIDGFPRWSHLTPDGILSGTPDLVGSLVLKFSVTDSSGGTQSAEVFFPSSQAATHTNTTDCIGTDGLSHCN